MIANMIGTALEQHQVFQSVVRSVVVQMVHYLARSEGDTVGLFPDNTMFGSTRAIWHGDPNVTVLHHLAMADLGFSHSGAMVAGNATETNAFAFRKKVDAAAGAVLPFAGTTAIPIGRTTFPGGMQ